MSITTTLQLLFLFLLILTSISTTTTAQGNCPSITTQSPPSYTTTAPPIFTQYPPLVNQDSPPTYTTTAPPVLNQSPPVAVQSPPVAVQSPPRNTPAPPVLNQFPPVTTQSPPVLNQSPPVAVQSPPVAVQSPPRNTPAPPVLNQFPPVTTQSPPVLNESPPRNTPAPPVLNQESPRNTQSPPFLNQSPPETPQSPPFLNQSPPPPPPQSNQSIFSTILSTLGYPTLSLAATSANLTTSTPTTIFAPSDSSLLTCPSCSLPLLLQEHSLPSLYPLHYLLSLSFGTKISTLAPHRCLTITSSPSPPKNKIFINGVEISKPDIYNDGFLIIHGLQGFISHLSPLSCNIESMTTLDYYQPPKTTSFPDTKMLLKEAMMKLRVSGYSVVALAMRVKYSELNELNGLTVFALDDESIFAGGIGHKYVRDIGYHIMPNRVMVGSELVGLAPFTVLDTTERGQSLVVTTAGGGGPMVPMRINYVKIKSFDLVSNDRIVVHGLSMPFPHVEDPRKM